MKIPSNRNNSHTVVITATQATCSCRKWFVSRRASETQGQFTSRAYDEHAEAHQDADPTPRNLFSSPEDSAPVQMYPDGGLFNA